VKHALVCAIFALAAAGVVVAQDVEYVNAIERAQQQRPAALESSARIAPAGESGSPMI
jgi:hypothetical protein